MLAAIRLVFRVAECFTGVAEKKLKSLTVLPTSAGVLVSLYHVGLDLSDKR